MLPQLMARGSKSLNAEQIQDRMDELQTSMGADGKAGDVEFALQTKKNSW
jgi:hypothetical protein